MVYQRTFLPSRTGHNHFSIGGIEPGVNTLRQLFFRDYSIDPDTGEYTDDGPSNWTGWTSFLMKIQTSRPGENGYKSLFDVPGVVESVGGPEGGGINFEIADRFVEFFILTAPTLLGFEVKRGWVSVSGVNPDGKRVGVGTGSWFLKEGSK